MNINLQSHKTQLLLAAVAGSAATVAAFSSYQVYTRKQRRQQLRDEIREALAHQDSSAQLVDPINQFTAPEDILNLISERVEPVRERILRGEHPDELFREQLARCYALFKEDGMERIRKSKVVIVGCGGVGSWAAVMLVRSCVQSRTFVL